MVHKTIILQDYGLPSYNTLYPLRQLISGRLHSAAIQKINITDTDTASIDERAWLLATIE
jgi:hypothetical protein